MGRPRKLRATWMGNFDLASIGSGWRCVGIRKFGTKWVHLTEIGSGTNFKMHIQAWRALNKRPIVKGKVLFDEKGPHHGEHFTGGEARGASKDAGRAGASTVRQRVARVSRRKHEGGEAR